jgi:predicted RNase H-like HicB family nuclease
MNQPGRENHGYTRVCTPLQLVLSLEKLMELTAVLTPAEEGDFVALNPETGKSTQGETFEEAMHNLKEATALFLAEFPLTTSGHAVITTFSIPAHA